jgi:hypothetical protein
MITYKRILLDTYNFLTYWKGRPKITINPPITVLKDRCKIIDLGAWSETKDFGLRITGDDVDSSFSYTWRSAFLLRLSNVWVTGDQGQVYLPDGSLLNAWLTPHEEDASYVKLRRPLPMIRKVINGPLFHLTGRNHENRGHFMLQYLPRLIAMREYLKNLPEFRILVAPSHASWQRRYLEWVGFEPERVIEGNQGTILARDLIFLPHLYDKSGLCPSYLYKELANCASTYSVDDGPGRPIFITRSDAPDKRLQNENRIIDILRAKIGPIDIVRLGEHSLPSQIGLFRAAPLIIGPIGQGLCNIIFCKNSIFVMLSPGSADKPIYSIGHGAPLASICGNQGVTFFSNEAVPSRGDWTFPEGRFEILIDRLLSQPEAVKLKRK